MIERGTEMPFILGIDGGATKTLAVVGDDTGRILAHWQGRQITRLQALKWQWLTSIQLRDSIRPCRG